MCEHCDNNLQWKISCFTFKLFWRNFLPFLRFLYSKLLNWGKARTIASVGFLKLCYWVVNTRQELFYWNCHRRTGADPGWVVYGLWVVGCRNLENKTEIFSPQNVWEVNNFPSFVSLCLFLFYFLTFFFFFFVFPKTAWFLRTTSRAGRYREFLVEKRPIYPPPTSVCFFFSF